MKTAFDTIDVVKVLDIMNVENGMGGVVLKWVRSFLKMNTLKVLVYHVHVEHYREQYWDPTQNN